MKGVVKVSWVFDVISPFAYLAFPQLARLPAHVSVEFVPVLLAGLPRGGCAGAALRPGAQQLHLQAQLLDLPRRRPVAGVGYRTGGESVDEGDQRAQYLFALGG